MLEEIGKQEAIHRMTIRTPNLAAAPPSRSRGGEILFLFEVVSPRITYSLSSTCLLLLSIYNLIG